MNKFIYSPQIKKYVASDADKNNSVSPASTCMYDNF